MKKLKKWIFVAVALLVIWAILSSTGVFFERISLRNVEGIKLRTSDGFTYFEADITEQETEKFVGLYNRSKHGGSVKEEPPREIYQAQIKLDDDRIITVGQGVQSYVIIDNAKDDRYYLENQELIDYIWELIAKYELPTDVG